MLEARALSFGYPGAERLYRDFNLSVAPGERVALSAPSGFGKTTLCRLLAGYEKPQAGGVFVDGEPLPERGVCPVQLVLQHPELAVDPRMRMADVLLEARAACAPASVGRDDLVGAGFEVEGGAALESSAAASARLACRSSVRKEGPSAGESLACGEGGASSSVVSDCAVRRTSLRAPFAKRKASRDLVLDDPELRRLIDGLGIQHRWLARFPHELSGGELQRFCLARALAVHPRYLVADEMSTMLDAITQARIWSFLLEELERGGAGLVFVSHSPALVGRIATRIVDLI